LQPFVLKNVSDKREAMISQIVALVFGAICLGVAFLAESLGGVFSAAMTILTVVGGPVLGIMTVGMFSTAVENKVKIHQIHSTQQSARPQILENHQANGQVS
jgi:Na+/proline symporter